jgi:hypothetical protein
MSLLSSRRSASPAMLEPLSPQRKWRAITIATLVLVPAFWSMLIGFVAIASDEPDAPDPAGPIALGLALIPFVFILLAFLSEHPNAPGAVLRAMGMSLLVGLVVSALAVDAVTGVVAGVGAGGMWALRLDDGHRMKTRALGVLVAAVYTFVLVRVVGSVALLPAPALPFTALGLADHIAERQLERQHIS